MSDEFALCKFTHLAVEPKAKRTQRTVRFVGSFTQMKMSFERKMKTI